MRIQYKLILVILSASVVLVASIYWLMQWSLTQGLIDFANNKERQALQPFNQQLASIYGEQNSWRIFKNQHGEFFELASDYLADKPELSYLIEYNQRPRGNRPPQHKPPHRKAHSVDSRPPPRHQQDKRYKAREYKSTDNRRVKPRPKKPHGRLDFALYTQDKKWLVGNPNIKQDGTWLAITHQQKTVGWLLLPQREQLLQGYELNLLEQQKSAYLLISALVLVLTLLFAIPLANHIVSPIKKITLGLSKLTQGQYKTRIALKRQDELGQLANDANELANTLSANEDARKRWFADISHELRTPLAIIQGEIEAMLDGIRPINQTSIESLEHELKRLQRLINDLYELSATDIGALKYRKAPIALNTLLEDEMALSKSNLAACGLTYALQLPQQTITVFADVDRLSQLMKNLCNNAAKYAGAHSKLSVSLEQQNTSAIIKFVDSGVGVDDKDLPLLFEHLYRVDNSRNSQTGGSGLGLAICKQIVTAHHGEITAMHTTGGGLTIKITLPMYQQ